MTVHTGLLFELPLPESEAWEFDPDVAASSSASQITHLLAAPQPPPEGVAERAWDADISDTTIAAVRPTHRWASKRAVPV
ncbi:hypothetical protein AB0E04_44855 [Streptomyces sp. NPDC048251]|uniref:hypothetical protein n=1 Tax=Streptomyces sp. NPDC048251 TaxID=3154501 RepID=UPI003421BEB0